MDKFAVSLASANGHYHLAAAAQNQASTTMLLLLKNKKYVLCYSRTDALIHLPYHIKQGFRRDTRF